MRPLNKYHLEILSEIKKAPKNPPGNFKGKPFDLNKYLGSPHKLYFLNSFTMQKIVRIWSKNHQSRIEEYLKANIGSLPKIAFRETTKKLLTGKK